MDDDSALRCENVTRRRSLAMMPKSAGVSGQLQRYADTQSYAGADMDANSYSAFSCLKLINALYLFGTTHLDVLQLE